MSALLPSASLEEARTWLRDRIDEGASCPCCSQLAKVYRRPFNYQMAKSLIEVHRVAGRDWAHWPSVIGKQADEAKMRYWGLIEEAGDKREDGGRAGYWRITEDGAAFVQSRLRVPQFVRIYDGRCLGFDGPLISIQMALGTRFDYDALMRGGGA